MYQVYLIDDEPWVLIGLERLISWEEYGFCVTGKSTSSRDAWKKIVETKPDVVITDIRMPGLNGLELLKRIGEEKLDTKVVLVSGFAEFEYARTAIREGAFDYLVKPVSKEQLSDCIKKLGDLLKESPKGQDSNVMSEMIDMISKYKEECSAWEFLCDMYKQAVPKRRYYMASLYRFEEGQKLHAQNFSNAMVTASLVPIGKNEMLAVIGSDFCEEPKHHAMRMLEQIKKQQGKDMQRIICGSSRIFEQENQVYKMFRWAKNGCDSAQFTGKELVVDHKDLDWGGREELVRQIQYQRNSVGNLLEELEALVQSGEVLLGELWNYIRLMRRAFAEARKGQNLLEFECESAEDLLWEYKDCDTFFSSLKKKLTFDENAQMMEQIREYIDCHYMENRTAAALSSEFGISQGYLSQMIKRETGKTYSELIQQKKLEMAKELLKYSQKTVGQIAEETGYSDYYYFTKTFKRLTKMSPSEYRKKEQV